MRKVTRKIIVHCSATTVDQDIGAAEIDAWHRKPPFNFDRIGYHVVIRRDGRVEFGRHMDEVGAHCRGMNWCSVGVCLIGGLRADGSTGERFDHTFTPHQDASLRIVLDMLTSAYPGAEVEGHRDQSLDLNNDGVITPDEWLKECPTFDVIKWWGSGE